MIQWLRSLVFVITMYTMMPVMGLILLIPALVSRDAAVFSVRLYSKWIVALARPMVGIRTEVRGTVPKGGVMIAAKHQSFFDILVLVATLERPRFIMKAELLWAPFLGIYAMQIGNIPVRRGRRGQAIQAMLDAVEKGKSDPGQMIIYPQGTRVPPGEVRPYKVGAALMYRDLGQPCVPVAVNVGLFWPKAGILKKPGLAIVEFLDPIAPGQDHEKVLKELEAVIEPRSNALMGFSEKS
ncbi:MAG: lysophospholipid acyltransferase family protein [Pseudomonadota bacterium]